MSVSGRNLIIKKNAVAIASVKSKSLSVNNEPVDITNDDGNGYRQILGVPGVRSIDLSLEGVADAILRDIVLNKQVVMLTDITVEFYDEANALDITISGDFFLSSVEFSGDTGDALNFSASLASSDEWTYTAA